MSFINIIHNSRNVLKNVLDIRGYNSGDMVNYTVEQLDELYDKGSADGEVNDVFSFSVKHKEVPDLKTHVMYYNLPNKGDTKSLRVTRSIVNFIEGHYEEDDVNFEDNCLIIINEQVSNSIRDLIFKYNLVSKERIVNDEVDELNPAIQEFIGSEDNKYNISSIHNVHIIWLNVIALDPLNHIRVPKHRIIKDKAEIKELLEKCNCKKSQLPIINAFSDTIAVLHEATPGDLCEIIRINKHSGVSYNYRLCK